MKLRALCLGLVALVACSSNTDEPPAFTVADSSTSDATVLSDASEAIDSAPASDAAADSSAPKPKRVFVSSGVFTGDLKTAGAGASGPEGADKLCNGLASTATLGGTWKAWISTASAKASSRLVDVGGWHLVTPDGSVGALVFSNLAATASASAVAIDRNENGADVGMGYPVWTGTRANGDPGDTCTDWTSEAPAASGTRGASNGTVVWTENNASAPCNDKKAIYCFEQ